MQAGWPVGWLARCLGSMCVALVQEVPAEVSCLPEEMEKDEQAAQRATFGLLELNLWLCKLP